MRKLLLFALTVLICSCGKSSVEISGDYVVIHFKAGTEETKATLNGRSVFWTGEETVNIWYKDASGKAASTIASFDSFSGKTAVLSATIPASANMDEFYAEVNGVSDSNSDRYPWGSNGPRTLVPAEQTAIAGSFDPAAAGMAACWRRSAPGEQPSFSFVNLHNILVITVDNQTNKTIDRITLSSSSSLVCKNYWSFKDDGSIKQTYSAGSGTEISLTGSIGSGRGDYCFVVPVKNNNGSKFKLDDMTVRFHFSGGEYFKMSNDRPLELDYNSIAAIGTFVLKNDKLVYPYGAPFGTFWGTAFMKSWNSSGFSANTPFTGLATEDTRETVSATATASCANSINSNASGNERMVGKFKFEFTAAETGSGTLVFWSKAGSTSHTTRILKNNILVETISYSSTSHVRNSIDIDVKAGDVISIQYNNTSSNATLYCGGDYTSSSEGVLDRRIRWNINAEAAGTISSPDDLSSDDQSSFFNEI